VHQIANPLNLLDVFGGRRDYQLNKINGLGVKSVTGAKVVAAV
jgi:hypothetical protein